MITTPQILSFAVIAIMMGAFVWGRFRYYLVAALALLLALALGVVPLDDAFTGFSDDIVIIVGSALLVSAGIARSGIMELAIQRRAGAGGLTLHRECPDVGGDVTSCADPRRTFSRLGGSPVFLDPSGEFRFQIRVFSKHRLEDIEADFGDRCRNAEL